MTHTLDFTYAPALTLNPKTPEEEKMQNLYCLLNTYIAEVPCYRTFGLDKSYMSAPINLSKTMLVAAIAEALSNFFPELRLEKVDFAFDGDSPDSMGCRIEVSDNEEF